MLRTKVKRRVFAAAIAATSIVGFSISSMADGHKVLDSIHFLIPGGAGGGWDGTARGTGEALTNQGLLVLLHMKICLVEVAVKPSGISLKMPLATMAH